MSHEPRADNSGLVVEMLSSAGDGLLRCIAHLFTEVANGREAPASWKTSNLSVLFKAGDCRLPEYYRPLAMLPILYKLFSKVLWSIVRDTLDSAQTVDQAGFRSKSTELSGLSSGGSAKGFNPGFNEKLRKAIHEGSSSVPNAPRSLDELVDELEKLSDFVAENSDSPLLTSSSGSRKPLFDADAKNLLNFLKPRSGSGPRKLSSYRELHSPDAADFVNEIKGLLDEGQTVILDLGNASDEIRRYFSDMLSQEIFRHQERKFVENRLDDHYIQLYFEEAHNLFPKTDNSFTGVYARFAKEGAKFHIGMVYSTQSPSTVNKELLAQTENFVVGHISSQDEVNTLAKLQVQFDGLQQDILNARTPGYMRMLTFSHRFVVPVQVNKFEAVMGAP